MGELSFFFGSFPNMKRLGPKKERSHIWPFQKENNQSVQIIIFHQHGIPWNKGNSLPKPPFGVRSCEVAIIWPEPMDLRGDTLPLTIMVQWRMGPSRVFCLFENCMVMMFFILKLLHPSKKTPRIFLFSGQNCGAKSHSPKNKCPLKKDHF